MNFEVEHPSLAIDRACLDAIRETAADAEELKDLHPRQLNLICQHKWFRMFIPVAYGGLGWSLPRVLRMEESLSWADGSTGWVVTLCSGAGWFTGFLQPSLLEEISNTANVCFAGSGAVGGTATITPDGFEVTGHWKYASGSLHATVFTANCFIQSGGVRQCHPDGSPMISAFLFLRQEVSLQRTWNSMGMIATGSHSFEVRKLHVPADRRFTIDPVDAILKDPVYRYPFLQLAETTLSVNLSGMAMRFLDLCAPLFSERMKRRNQSLSAFRDVGQLLAGARASMERHRNEFYKTVDSSWAICSRGAVLTADVLHEVSAKSHALARRSLHVVDDLYPLCGLSAADTRSEINRVWRNIHTASQHSLFRMGADQ